MADPYVVIAWALASYIAGLATCYVVLRRDLKLGAVAPTASDRPARRVLALDTARLYFGASPSEPQPVITRELRNVVDQQARDVDLLERAEVLVFPVEIGGRFERIQVQARYVSRFISCPTPARSEWYGDRKIYGDLLKVGASYGWLVNQPKGVTWSHEYRSLGRRLARFQEVHRCALPQPEGDGTITR